MSSLVKSCVRTAAVLGIVAAGFACKKKDEYGSATGTASPGTGTYSSPESGPYGSPGTTGGLASPGMGTAPGSMMVQVTSVDRQANTITVTDSATTSPRTLTVDAAARGRLADLRPGDQVTITCAASGLGSTMGSGGPLGDCTTVASITTEPGSSRGR